MGRKKQTKRKRIENFEEKPGKEKPDQGREHITKYLQKVYSYVTKESDLFWGLKDQDIVPNDSKRVPGTKRPKIEPKKEEEEQKAPTVSEGYGEATLGSISRLLRALETLDEEDLRLSRNSTFVDIGSGYGKVVFHARLFSRVCKSFGIEYVQRRCEIAQRAQQHFRFKHIIDAKPGETNKENHAGNGVPLTTEVTNGWSEKKVEEDMASLLGDEVSFVCDDATNRAPFDFTHIYMYDCIFSEDTYEKLLPQLEESPFKILVCFRTLNFLTTRGLTHIRPLGTIRISSTGRQCFTAHIYAKTTDGEVDVTTNVTTTTEQQTSQTQLPQEPQPQEPQLTTQQELPQVQTPQEPQQSTEPPQPIQQAVAPQQLFPAQPLTPQSLFAQPPTLQQVLAPQPHFAAQPLAPQPILTPIAPVLAPHQILTPITPILAPAPQQSLGILPQNTQEPLQQQPLAPQPQPQLFAPQLFGLSELHQLPPQQPLTPIQQLVPQPQQIVPQQTLLPQQHQQQQHQQQQHQQQQHQQQLVEQQSPAPLLPQQPLISQPQRELVQQSEPGSQRLLELQEPQKSQEPQESQKSPEPQESQKSPESQKSQNSQNSQELQEPPEPLEPTLIAQNDEPHMPVLITVPQITTFAATQLLRDGEITTHIEDQDQDIILLPEDSDYTEVTRKQPVPLQHQEISRKFSEKQELPKKELEQEGEAKELKEPAELITFQKGEAKEPEGETSPTNVA